MRFYFAPMEGITDAVYRRLHYAYFGGPDQYYMPFFSPTVHRSLTARESRELPDAGTVPAVPQLLTKNPEDFLWASRVCLEKGYQQVNLNLGCPSGTVVAKGKGAGMLADTDGLDRFLEQIFCASPLPVSIKTRLGMESPEEFPSILEVLNRYPIQELILHPRVRREFYSGSVHMDSFRYLMENSRNPVCFNGNLCTPEDIRRFSDAFPQAGAVMLGRGLIGDPGMLLPGGTDRDTLEQFCGELLEQYTICFGSARNAMFRLKESWRYLLRHFGNSEKLGKRLRKTTDLQEFQAITSEIFHTLPFLTELNPDW